VLLYHAPCVVELELERQGAKTFYPELEPVYEVKRLQHVAPAPGQTKVVYEIKIQIE
jgi:hypothetical protein